MVEAGGGFSADMIEEGFKKEREGEREREKPKESERERERERERASESELVIDAREGRGSNQCLNKTPGSVHSSGHDHRVNKQSD